MKLDMNLLAGEGMRQDVDIERLYVELVESLVGIEDSSIELPGNISASTIDHDSMRRKIRELGYEGLKNRQWVSVLELDETEMMKIMDNIERFMIAYGRYIKIGDKDELELALATYETLRPHLPRDPFLYCLAETALNQVLDAKGIGRIEMNRIRSRVDVQLSEQNRIIAQMIREKIGEVLNGGSRIH